VALGALDAFAAEEGGASREEARGCGMGIEVGCVVGHVCSNPCGAYLLPVVRVAQGLRVDTGPLPAWRGWLQSHSARGARRLL
jgi:hypothetical protein